MKKTLGINLVYILLLAVSGTWIWFTRIPDTQTGSNDMAIPRPGFTAPDFQLPSASGEMFSIAELKGKPIVINFWASWCPPCRAEMPALQNAYEDLLSSDLVLLAINTTYQDQTDAAVNFYNELGLTFPLIFDHNGTTSRLYQINALPTTFFVDRDGIIREVVVGGPMAEALIRVRFEQLTGD